MSLLAQAGSLGIFDALTLAVAAVGYAIGRKRGLVWQLSGVATLLLGGACATILARPVGALFADGILGRFVGWVAIYAVVAICLYVLSLKLKHRIEKLEFDELDQRFGGLLGAFKGLFAFAILVLIAAGISEGVARAVRESASGRALLVVVEELRPVVPERIRDALFPPPGAAPAAEPDPATQPPEGATSALDPSAPDPIYRPLEPAAPTPARPAPSRRPAPVRALPPEPAQEDPREVELVPQRARPAADPFDTREDPLDPLAPPR